MKKHKIDIPEGCKASVQIEENNVIVLIEEKEAKFKRGDILAMEIGILKTIFIVDKYKAEKYMCVTIAEFTYGAGVAYGHCIYEHCAGFRLATAEEQQILFDVLAKEGKRWNAEKCEIEDIEKPFLKGDILFYGFGHNNHRLAIVKGTEDHLIEMAFVVDINRYNACSYNTILDLRDVSKDYPIRHATESECKVVIDKLTKEGKRINPDTKEIEDIEKPLLVPESVKIYKRKIGDPRHYGDGLFVGFGENQVLGFKNGNYHVDVDGFGLYKEVPRCQLTPCKREDLKAGDTAFFSISMPLVNDMNNLFFYCKILCESEFVHIVGDKEIESGSRKDFTWYKLTPIE